jgi:hypothetical protein
MAEARKRLYMPDRVSLASVGVGAAIIAGAIGFGFLAAYAAVHLGSARPTVPPARPGAPPAIAAPVVLQPTPAQDIASFSEEKRRLLSSYGWDDREHGFARIPIERAMTLLAARPVPAKKP